VSVGTPAPAGAEDLGNPSRTATKDRSFELTDLAVFGAVILAAIGHLMIKAGLTGVAATTAQADIFHRLLVYFSQPYVVLGLMVYGIGTAMWIFAVSKYDISYVFPISALNYVLVTLGGKFLFGELIPAKRWAGVAVVIVGVALMQSSGREGKR
jgi:drug/metabolite transporter (DMT)-like permease